MSGPMGGPGGPGRRRGPLGRPPVGPGKRPGEPGGFGNSPESPAHGPKKAAELDLKELEKQSEEMMTMHFLTGASARFNETEGGFLSLDYDHKNWDRVQIVRTFPFSDNNSFLSVREYTETAKEIGIIRDLYEDFPKETAAVQ